jgi:hypothetical protein
MSTSKKALMASISKYFAEQTNFAKSKLRQDAEVYLGEYNQHFMDFLVTYYSTFSNHPLNADRFYRLYVRALAAKICEKVATQNTAKLRIPMLSELQELIEKQSYSFQMLRGTSYLCEVQISTK